MRYNVIVSLISKKLADEIVSESEMLSYMDSVIDDINTELNASFPTFTEYKEQNTGISGTLLDYTVIPDKYIRTVVIPGAAFKFYTTDEEGGYSAPKYEEEYKHGLFYMLRDFSLQIPEEYQASNQGYITIAESENPAGIYIPPYKGGSC
jgi:hypothetical protein